MGSFLWLQLKSRSAHFCVGSAVDTEKGRRSLRHFFFDRFGCHIEAGSVTIQFNYLPRCLFTKRLNVQNVKVC